MQQIASAVNLVLRGLFAIATLAALSNCGVVAWREVYCSSASHSNVRACVEQKCGMADCSLRIVVYKGSGSEQIAYRRGCIINFAEASWTGSTIAMFVDGGYCQQLEVAYDAGAQRVVPASTFESALRSAIVNDYRVSPSELRAAGGDVFQWATYPGDGNPHRSKEEFARRYPH
jgi:hypothetical protein